MKKMDETDLLRKAREAYSEAYDSDRINRENALDDLEFIAGDQWPESIRREREATNRPVITVNRMPQFVRQVTGDLRRNEPSIKVLPVDDEGDADVAEIYEGLIRQIEHQSDADIAYEVAAESAATCSMGALRVLADYADERSFDQELYIEAIPNPFAVVWDPLAKHPTRRDAEYCFVTSLINRDKFKEQYPDATLTDWERGEAPEYASDWNHGDDVMIAEYWVKEPVKKRIAQDETGGVWDVTDVPPAVLNPAWRVREVNSKEIACYKMSGENLLEPRKVWPGSYIPIVAVMGEEIHIGERRVRSSVIRYAKDPQRLYNYFRSTQTESIALQPKAPYLMTPKQIEGHEGEWNAANETNYAYLLYNPDPGSGGAPQRQPPPVPSVAMAQEIALAADDMKATTGVYDAALGSQSNETSGVAIRQRQQEGDISTSIYADNLVRAVRQVGRVLIEAIPKIYDTTRTVRMLAVDGSETRTRINVPVQTPYGVEYMNDLSVGRYDIRIATGPSFTTQRQQAAQSMLDFAQAFPQAGAAVMDLVAKNMDWPGAEEMAERLKKLLPPGMADMDDPTPEQQQEMTAQKQAEAQQSAMAQKAGMIELAKAKAEADEAMSKASEAKVDVADKQLELAMKSGQFDQAVMQAVQQVLSQQMQPAPQYQQQLPPQQPQFQPPPAQPQFAQPSLP